MSLTQALGAAAAGLRVSEAGLSLIAANVANAQTPGYVRKTVSQQITASGGDLVSVRVAAINRELDQYLQRQLRAESSGGAYADAKAQYYQRLQKIYGDPGSPSSLETVYTKLTAAAQALATSPADYSARANLLNAAQAVTQQLNSLTSDIQGVRGDTEQALADAVRSANTAIQGLAQVNAHLATSQLPDASKASLLDQRDQYLDQLAQLMDIKFTENQFNQVTVFTSSGVQLLGAQTSRLSFDTQGMMTATAEWSSDPAQRQVGTITLTSQNGASIDLVATKAFRSGRIAALLEMRDQVLVQAQSQLDEFAAGLARLLSDRTTPGTAVNPGPQHGFDVDTSNLLAGNSIEITYTDTLTNTRRKATIVRVDDPRALPLADTATADPNDRVVGVDWSGGLAAVVAQLNAAFNGKVQFANPSGSTLSILDDGNANTSRIDAVSTTTTATSLNGGTPELAFFSDGVTPYSGAITVSGSQAIGFAGRIAVNPALLADPSKLVAYQTATATGDQTRPNFIYDQLTSASITFAPRSGIGTARSPYSGSLASFWRQSMNQQGEAASAAESLNEGQTMVVNALKQRFNDSASVNIDQEMSNLLTLQTAYGANARVFSAVNDMIQTLLRM
ncbi:MAG: flagellar hook-associated protein FlgK [Bradyrhizobium sp.]